MKEALAWCDNTSRFEMRTMIVDLPSTNQVSPQRLQKAAHLIGTGLLDDCSAGTKGAE